MRGAMSFPSIPSFSSWIAGRLVTPKHNPPLLENLAGVPKPNFTASLEGAI